MNVLPSRNFVLILASLLVSAGVIGGAYFLATRSAGAPLASAPAQTGMSDAPQAVLEAAAVLDSDEDGLRNWEERLWGTDPENPDTDGDGTPDGDEVDSSRDPRVAGPDDALTSAAIPRAANTAENTSGTSTQDLTLTDEFSRDLFEDYVRARQGSESLDAFSQEQLLSSVTSSAAFETVAERTSYVRNDLSLVQDTSREGAASYGNRVGLAIQANSFESEHETVLLKRAVEESDDEALASLRHIAEGYRGIEQDLRETRVPEEAASAHLRLLNAVAFVAGIVEGMGMYAEDPLRALLAVRDYQSGGERLLDGVVAVQNYLAGHGVSYADDEPGMTVVEVGNN